MVKFPITKRGFDKIEQEKFPQMIIDAARTSRESSISSLVDMV